MCSINQPSVIVGSTEDERMIVDTRDWTSFFATQMKKLPGIKKFHHFIFSSSKPGLVYARETRESEERSTQTAIDGC